MNLRTLFLGVDRFEPRGPCANLDHFSARTDCLSEGSIVLINSRARCLRSRTLDQIDQFGCLILLAFLKPGVLCGLILHVFRSAY
jgi:hypothetical protein